MDEKYFPEKIERVAEALGDERAFESREDDPRPKFYALEDAAVTLRAICTWATCGTTRSADALPGTAPARGLQRFASDRWDSFGQPA